MSFRLGAMDMVSLPLLVASRLEHAQDLCHADRLTARQLLDIFCELVELSLADRFPERCQERGYRLGHAVSDSALDERRVIYLYGIDLSASDRRVDLAQLGAGEPLRAGDVVGRAGVLVASR
jgi:hypothetical protein